MKKLLFLTTLLMPGLALAQYYPPHNGYGGPPAVVYYPHDRFEHMKHDKLREIDARIADLQNRRNCVLSAGNPGMLHACDEPVAPAPVIVEQAPPPPPRAGVVIDLHH